jgi:DNA polymerase III alpha subunit
MSCVQIATELAPYAQQMMPNIQALGASQQQLYTQARQQLETRKVEHEALTPLATAGALDNTGASKQAYQLALMAQMAKEKSENEAFANSPLAQQNKAQTEQVAAQAQQMQSNVRRAASHPTANYLILSNSSLMLLVNALHPRAWPANRVNVEAFAPRIDLPRTAPAQILNARG